MNTMLKHAASGVAAAGAMIAVIGADAQPNQQGTAQRIKGDLAMPTPASLATAVQQ